MVRCSDRLKPVGVLIVALLGCQLAGCGIDEQHAPMSPTVSADSEAGAKARAQDEKLRADRRKQEAGFHRRRPKLPAGAE